ncbi:MAG: hypothetical protein COA36_16870 [Desulfotalea sp.]|nr:MAG: hypothetical protein COA36_16870 [Desulfotalea sp.]
MRGYKELMEDIMEGEQYVTCVMPAQIYHQIQNDLQHQMYTRISVKTCKYKEDPRHCELLKVYLKAKKQLTDREFEINNK